MKGRAGGRVRGSGESGFTLIEVLVAILVMAFGLLGFAMLQTMNVRFTQSANYRTQATNLAYELLDQVRANRVLAAAYVGNYTASVTTSECTPTLGANATPAQYRDAWECRLGKTLGEGATATVARDANDLVVTVTWDDGRWAGATDTSFVARTRL